MPNWEHFRVDYNREQPAILYGPDERDELELRVAEQVVVLLSLFGKIQEVEHDVSNRVDLEELVSYRTVGLDDIVLGEDEDSIIIGQLPLMMNGVLDVSPGTYWIAHEDVDGGPQQDITVKDPLLQVLPPLYYSTGARIEQSVVQEHFELLGNELDSLRQYEKPNIPLLEPHTYPMVLSDPDFEQIIENFFV